MNEQVAKGVGPVANVAMRGLLDGTPVTLHELMAAHGALLVLDFFLASGKPRTAFPVVGVDA